MCQSNMTQLRWQCLKYSSVNSDELKQMFHRRMSRPEVEAYVWERCGWQFN